MSDGGNGAHAGEPVGSGGLGTATDRAAPRREPLDRRRILVAGLGFVDEQGRRALTMRSIGERLGVEAMSLYRYVPGKDALLDGIVETVIDGLYGDPDVHMGADHGWPDYLQRLAHGVRRIALDHPQVFPLIATRPPAAPWVRPPLRSLRWMENFLDTLQGCGFDDAAAVAAYRAFSSFLLGHLLLEVSAQGVDTGPVEENDPSTPERADLSGYPRLAHLEEELSQDRSAAEFEQSLENLIDRLETSLRR
jgi:AcrR family transcriptional regulator